MTQSQPVILLMGDVIHQSVDETPSLRERSPQELRAVMAQGWTLLQSIAEQTRPQAEQALRDLLRNPHVP